MQTPLHAIEQAALPYNQEQNIPLEYSIFQKEGYIRRRVRNPSGWYHGNRLTETGLGNNRKRAVTGGCGVRRPLREARGRKSRPDFFAFCSVHVDFSTFDWIQMDVIGTLKIVAFVY